MEWAKKMRAAAKSRLTGDTTYESWMPTSIGMTGNGARIPQPIRQLLGVALESDSNLNPNERGGVSAA